MYLMYYSQITLSLQKNTKCELAVVLFCYFIDSSIHVFSLIRENSVRTDITQDKFPRYSRTLLSGNTQDYFIVDKNLYQKDHLQMDGKYFFTPCASFQVESDSASSYSQLPSPLTRSHTAYLTGSSRSNWEQPI